MTIAATFSNGQTDAYKGAREVRAAWAIFNRATGDLILSGHSMNRQNAAKTADGKLQHLPWKSLGLPTDHALRYFEGGDWRDTVKQKRAKRVHNAARLGLISSLTRIEIVDL